MEVRHSDHSGRGEGAPGEGRVSRRNFLGMGLASAGLLAGVASAGTSHSSASSEDPGSHADSHGDADHLSGTVGDVDPQANGFDPGAFLTSFDFGEVSTLPGGRTLRTYRMAALGREIEVAPGIFFPAWTFNGTVPGPTLRCTEGDRVRVMFLNANSHPHNIHFHGFHEPGMDGLEPIPSGGQFVYEFDARPFGLHLYHCHMMPLKRHIHKGLYGTFIIDPPGGRPPARELVMVMNGFDTNFDGENEVYAVNTVAFHYQRHPIQVRVGELVRIYLVNTTEFDPVNSLHMHAIFIHVYKTGSSLQPSEYTDTIMMCQGERHVIEFRLPWTGKYMFHAHQSEFAELGWLGFFEALEEERVSQTDGGTDEIN